MNNKDTLLKRAKELENLIELENKKILLGKNKYTNLGENLLTKAKLKERALFNEVDDNLNTLFHRFKVSEEKDKGNKENLSLLEKGLAEGNEMTKIINKKRKTKPTIVNETIDTTATILPYDDKFEKLQYYAEKYRIPYKKAGAKKSFKDLAHDIAAYEKKNLNRIKLGGLDKKYKELGHYIKII
jgi:hypothetical protein